MPERNVERIRKSLLAPLATALLFFMGVAVFSCFWLQKQHINESVRTELNGVQRLFRNMLDEETKHISSLIDFYEQDISLQKAYRAKDRDSLLKLALPLFNNLRAKYQITHFYFHDLDKVCFLRVHNPPRYGDQIDRFTLEQAEREKTTTHGIELGPFGTFTLRVVKPWRIDGKLVGYIEFGREIEHITPVLKSVLGVEIFFAVKKAYLKKGPWEEGLKMMGRSAESDTWDKLPNHIIIDRTLKEIPAPIWDSLHNIHSKHKNYLLKFSLDGRKYRGGFVPLLDASANDVGEIIILKDFTKEEQALRLLSLFLTLVIVTVGILLFILYYLYIGRIEDNLVLIAEEREKLIDNLQKALEEIKTLRGIIPICSHCKKIRDDKGLWNQLEAYIRRHSDAKFSHGICPDCRVKYYSEFEL